ncbi:MAG: hypothetical protein PHQ43_05455 [Dehalococcoidales bacterium]|nr:hypothetical protein [Dehalococcoidales bacterium]
MDKNKLADLVSEAKIIVDQVYGLGDSLTKAQTTVMVLVQLVEIEKAKEAVEALKVARSCLEESIKPLPVCEHCGHPSYESGFPCCPEGFHKPRVLNA